MNLQDLSALFLALLTTCSFITFYTPLATYVDGSFGTPPDLILEGLNGDPFVVTTKEEDFLDGYPSRSSGPFWDKVRFIDEGPRRALFMTE